MVFVTGSLMLVTDAENLCEYDETLMTGVRELMVLLKLCV